ncbi:universal stress protein [Streptomyces sp. 1331.2]|uniref:universal stress protein n=1 Tax=Streptomyces sp. 1331.2 TaxID=1938835 RepID=UPI000BD0C1A4|nr:universal stress protein [Streptomyces sp. 1331.2]SOB81011.1 Nucleotide-binding universal stress protein, UspA family [Streptomyces sp. 1331.2]
MGSSNAGSGSNAASGSADAPGGIPTAEPAGSPEGARRSPGPERRIVVGIDGSAPSKAALRWAVGQAVLTGAAVHAVAAWEYPSLYGWFAPMVDDGFEQTARRTLSAEINEVLGPERPVEVRESLVLGHAADVLLEAAEDADLLVLGSRGRGTFARTLLGSVSARCAVHGSCPVVIVRSDGTATAPHRPTASPATAAADEAAKAAGAAGAAEPVVRTKDWQLSLHVVEDRDTTRVHAVLDADGTVLHSDARSRRNPRDTPAPQVGDEFAVGRALVDLGHQLLRAGMHDATDRTDE